jgi:hypothetical protein
MCGIAGFIGPQALNTSQRKKRQRVVTGLMLANTSRGIDAAGIAFVCPEGPTIVKGTGSAWSLIERPEYLHGFRPGVASIIGHTRLATHGENTNQNAHPFRERTIVGVHNGVISNYDALDKEIRHGWKRPVEVDSQVVFRMLAGVRPTRKRTLMAGYAEVLPRLSGNMTLVWADDRDPDATYVFRHENPLAMVLAKHARGAFVSSEFPPLAAAVQSMYGSAWESFTLVEDKLYRFTWDEKSGVMYDSIAVVMPTAYSYGTAYPYSGGFGSGSYRKLNEEGEWVEDDDTDTTDSKVLYDSWCTICDDTVAPDESGAERMNDGSVICPACAKWWRAGVDKDGRVFSAPMETDAEVSEFLAEQSVNAKIISYAKRMKPGETVTAAEVLAERIAPLTYKEKKERDRKNAAFVQEDMLLLTSGEQKGAH